MKTQYYTATSLDGFIADPDNSLEWLFQFGSGPGQSYSDFIAEVGAIAMGSTTYEWVLDHQSRQAGESAPAWVYEQPTWIFTTRELPKFPDSDLQFVSGDVRPVHRAMTEAAGGRNLWIVGGGDLVGQFHEHGLLDEIIVQIAPVTLGGGAPLLPRRIAAPPLKLVSAVPDESGFVEIRYEVQK